MATSKQRTKFIYEPLDTTQQSIRLISVDPELSPEGFVQCSIRHTTIDAQYNCLSYRWGPPDLSNTLIINGQALSINGYLHDFLAEVRTFTYQAPDQSIASHLRENLWIDAVCIDQNSTSEKNHQVGQMGKIYTNASKVIMWLGNRYSDYEYTELPSPNFHDYNWFIIDNHYWTRAWIAQEVMLAKDPVLMIADYTTRRLIHFADFVEMDLHSQGELKVADMIKGGKVYGTPDVLLAYLNLVHNRKNVPKKPWIVEWLFQLRAAQSTLIHDRIFSLLELCAEGKDIPVDYNMPLTRLLIRVLEARGHVPCLCEVLLLIEVLKIGNEAIETSEDCVYVQLKAPSGRSDECGYGVKMILEKLREGNTPGNHAIVQAPLQDLEPYVYFTDSLCYDAIHGTPLVPVQVRLGPVYKWQVVPEDGKVENFLVNSDK